MQDALEAIVSGALLRAEPLRANTNAYRLIDEATGELPGLSVEVYGDHGVLLVYTEEALQMAAAVGTELLQLGFSGVYLKPHLSNAGSAQAGRTASELVCGVEAPEEFAVREYEQQALVWLHDGSSTGLFLDQRDNRARLRASCQGKRVLNLFCYTGAFTVAAALGKAEQTVSVDISGRALRRCGDNLALNGCEQSPHRLLKDDARKWLERALRRGDRFDWVVLDPPSFARVGSGTFSVTRDYSQLAGGALALLAPGGTLLAVTNHRGTNVADMTGILREAAARNSRSVQRIEALAPSVDCRDNAGQSATKSMLVTVA